MQFFKQKRGIFILVGAAIIIKLTILSGITGFRVWEENEMALNYLKTGQMVYNHDGAMQYFIGIPLYQLLLALTYKLFGMKYVYAIILNIAFSAISALLFYDVFSAFFERFDLPEKVKKWKSQMLFLSVAAFLFHPLIMYYELKNVHPFALYMLLLVLGLWMMVKYFEKSSWLNLTLYAIIVSLAILTRTTLVALLLPFFLWLWSREGLRKNVGKMVFVISVISVFSFLWSWNIKRNLSLGYITSNLGMNMWMGSLLQTEGSNNFPDGKTFYSALSDSDLAAIAKIPPVKRDSFYMVKYMYMLKNKPGSIAKMFLIKFKNFWLFRQAMGVDYPDKIQRLIPVYKIVYLAILLLALYVTIKIGKEAMVFLSVPFGVSLIHAVVYVETRHRIMFEPMFIFLAIIGISLVMAKLKRSKV